MTPEHEELKRLAEAATPLETDLYGDRYFQGPYSQAVLNKEQDAYYAAANPSAILDLIRQLEEAKAELERERMRLAGCGVAALGYFDGCCDEYKSASLDDVLRLRKSLEEVQADNERLRNLLNRSTKQIYAWAEKYGEANPEWLPPVGDVRLLEDISDVLAKANRDIQQLRKERTVTPEMMNTPIDAALSKVKPWHKY